MKKKERNMQKERDRRIKRGVYNEEEREYKKKIKKEKKISFVCFSDLFICNILNSMSVVIYPPNLRNLHFLILFLRFISHHLIHYPSTLMALRPRIGWILVKNKQKQKSHTKKHFVLLHFVRHEELIHDTNHLSSWPLARQCTYVSGQNIIIFVLLQIPIRDDLTIVHSPFFLLPPPVYLL